LVVGPSNRFDLVETACVDGVLLPLAEAVIPVTDDGLLRGDGVFEVIRLYDGVPFAPDRHLERLARSARNLRLELDIGGIARDIRALLAVTRTDDGLLRVVVTRGGHRIVLVEPLPVLPEALALGYVTFAPVRVLDGVKSLSYGANMHATRLARERGFDEALLVSPHGRVLELPTASLFWAADGEVYTPPLSDHILDSITRRIVIEVAGAK
jgi:branched-chain amino acid aminotransferase